MTHERVTTHTLSTASNAAMVRHLDRGNGDGAGGADGWSCDIVTTESKGKIVLVWPILGPLENPQAGSRVSANSCIGANASRAATIDTGSAWRWALYRPAEML